MTATNISDIMLLTMRDIWKKMVENSCRDLCRQYETDPKYNLKKFFENGELVGFRVYYDTPEFRFLEAGYYIGTNKLEFLREWRNITRGIKVLRAYVQKPNVKMVQFYQNMGFKVIHEDLNNYLFEKRS